MAFDRCLIKDYLLTYLCLTAGLIKRVRSMRLYHSRRCCIVLKWRSDRI